MKALYRIWRWLRGPWALPDPAERPATAARAGPAPYHHGDPSYLEVWAVGGRRPGYVGLAVATDDAWWLAGDHARRHGVGQFEARRQITGEVVWDVEVVHATPAEMAAGRGLSEAAAEAAAWN